MVDAVLSGLVTGWAIAVPIGAVGALLVTLTARHALATNGTPRATPAIGPARAFGLFLGITAVNPTTVVYFAAVVLGNRRLVEGRGRRRPSWPPRSSPRRRDSWHWRAAARPWGGW